MFPDLDFVYDEKGMKRRLGRGVKGKMEKGKKEQNKSDWKKRREK